MNRSINEIKNELENTDIKDIYNKMQKYLCDDRKGVKNIIKLYENKLIKYNNELIRVSKMRKYEEQLLSSGIKYIAGIDEVGRGSLAGPLVCASVILPSDFDGIYINDSKKIKKESKKRKLFKHIKENALDITVQFIYNNEVDNINILNATKKAMIACVEKHKIKPQHLLIDAVKLDIDIPFFDIIKGDEKSVSIASASIIAKVIRDDFMVQMDKLYPKYKFAQNKGYGVKEHIEIIEKYGICEIHRKTFIKKFI